MESIAPKAWQYGVLGVVALAFAYAIIHLFKALRADATRNDAREKSMEKERGEWAIERQRLVADYERKHRELVQDYAKQLREDRDKGREHEDKAREEFDEIMERVQASAEKQNGALVATLEKFYERFVGPARGRY